MPSFDSKLREIHLKTRAGWRSWLKKNHATCDGVWQGQAIDDARYEPADDAGLRKLCRRRHEARRLAELGGAPLAF